MVEEGLITVNERILLKRAFLSSSAFLLSLLHLHFCHHKVEDLKNVPCHTSTHPATIPLLSPPATTAFRSSPLLLLLPLLQFLFLPLLLWSVSTIAPASPLPCLIFCCLLLRLLLLLSCSSFRWQWLALLESHNAFAFFIIFGQRNSLDPHRFLLPGSSSATRSCSYFFRCFESGGSASSFSSPLPQLLHLLRVMLN